MKFQEKIPSILILLISLQAYSFAATLTGHVTYTLGKVANPSADQADAYAKITLAMDSATGFYNTLTTITKKLTIEYNTSVQTADGNSNGNIRFGRDRGYMKACTAMHEIAHTVGIGTTSQWGKFISNGKYTGANANKKLQEITGDPKSVLNGDSQHFWPYGLNYASEVKSVDDLIDHCLIVNAILKDFYPTEVIAHAPASCSDGLSVEFREGFGFTLNLAVPKIVNLSIFTLSGRKVLGFEQAAVNAGSHTINLAPAHLPRGFYIFAVQAAGRVEARQVTIR
jgi:hypothetical protein